MPFLMLLCGALLAVYSAGSKREKKVRLLAGLLALLLVASGSLVLLFFYA